ncbi:LOW QUALITY PROTEIN: Hypothetical protein PHPALM_14592 [Phytophthora palmivora]|uniref:Retrotransposon gag domain-containing protein n=1 Tax=Phytophthora palmivora TaxID=4796 RepID=A0A2P4XUE7_9STRA|nr:LOW QUALITY PROTEIN: Hypothetical protein PHPALM_14592 [Phytophthora palmivora]
MKTPETKKGELFRATAGTPYFEDSHMLSPKRNKWESEEGNSAESEDDSDDDHGYRPSRDETVKYQIYHLSNDRAQFDGRRYRSDDSLQWLKRFIYEMKGTRMPQDSWCEPFSLRLGRTAKSWYRQLPRKTQTRWNLLSEAFLDYYCSQFDQSTRTRYYSDKRKDKETICDFLTRLNGYARTAKLQYERGGADAADHVEHFFLNCSGDDIMYMLYPLQLNDILRVEQIINEKILGEKRKKQRDRLEEAEMNCADMIDETTNAERINAMPAETTSERSAEMNEEVIDAEKRAGIDGYIPQTMSSKNVTDRRDTLRGQLSRDAELYDSEAIGGYSTYGQDEDAEAEDDGDYVDTGLTSDRGDSARTPRNSARSFRGPTEGQDRRDTSRERQQYGPCAACGGMGHSAHFCRRRCKFCKLVHEVGQCELFRRYEKLASFVKNDVDKSKVPEELQDLYTPTEPVVEANFVFAFVGGAGWPEGSVGTD